jgi:predicted membrane channel-forming protein YqfA (hemolysin III family)
MRLPIVICIVLLIGFCSFLPYLDRYPEPYFDEAVYNNSAVRVHDGLSFAWPVATSAPYGNVVWAYHGPFFPRLQVLTMALLGVSQFACRVPEYAAAFAAVGLLCLLLYRRGLRWGALALAVFWLGDRSLVEALDGRMDGLALLCLVLAFGAFVRALDTQALWPVFWSGLWAATAVGFHPCTAPFAAMVAAVCLWRFPGRRLRVLCLLAAAAAIPALLVLASVAPHFHEALVQFLYHRRITRLGASGYTPSNLMSALRWSRYWCLVLVCVAGALAIPAAATLLKSGEDQDKPASGSLFLAASLFSLAAFVTFAATAVYTALYPYYFIYLSVWPVVAVIAALDQRAGRLWIRRAGLVCLAVLTVAWLPSALWNVMRWREAPLFARGSIEQAFDQQVLKVVPPGGNQNQLRTLHCRPLTRAGRITSAP